MLPATSARAMLEGFCALGLARAALLEHAGLANADLEGADAVVDEECVQRMWMFAVGAIGRETLPLEVGLAVPYGAFSALDFLAGTSATVLASLRSLSAYFRLATDVIRLDIDEEAGRLRVLNEVDTPIRPLTDLFTLGVVLGRYRAMTEGAFAASLEVAAPAPGDIGAFERAAGVPVRFERRVSAVVLAPSTLRARLRSSDARLHETLRTLAQNLDLGHDRSDLERALRIRLRSALPEGNGSAAAMARALGMSERTLQRRLEETGRTFQGVVEDFRHEEALRLLDDARLSLAQIALRLGFSEQSSFTRAFRRWTGRSPGEMRERAGRGT